MSVSLAFVLSLRPWVHAPVLTFSCHLNVLVAAKFVEDIVNGDSSIGDAQSEGDRKLSQTKLQGSFDALMSMDIQSVENLVELASSSQSSAILSEMARNASIVSALTKNDQSCSNMSSRMESFIKSLSSANLLKSGLESQVALGSLLKATSSNSIMDAAGMLPLFELLHKYFCDDRLSLCPEDADLNTYNLNSQRNLQRDSNRRRGFLS